MSHIPANFKLLTRIYITSNLPEKTSQKHNTTVRDRCQLEPSFPSTNKFASKFKFVKSCFCILLDALSQLLHVLHLVTIACQEWGKCDDVKCWSTWNIAQLYGAMISDKNFAMAQKVPQEGRKSSSPEENLERAPWIQFCSKSTWEQICKNCLSGL